MGSPTLRVLLLLTAFLLDLPPAALQTHQPCPCGEVLTNFDCSINGNGDRLSPCSQCQHKLRESPSQLLPALLLSTVQCCKHEKQTCLQVYVALNSTGIEGFELDFLVPSSNRYKLQVLKTQAHQNNTTAKWQMQFDGFQVASGEQVHVSVKTIPPRKLNLSQSYTVTNNQPGKTPLLGTYTMLASPHAHIIESVDVNPQLCFKFSYMNTSHTECPHQTDATWNVSLHVKFLQLHLNFRSRTAASFSSSLCQPVSSSQCQPEPAVYTITHTGGSALGEMNLILPWTVLRSCVLVWRSDVQFAGKRLLCPDGKLQDCSVKNRVNKEEIV
ncbi:interleukin-17 receptor E [Notechis scutatus]|uniref:Interleukin-17 receptor E n=1 Tax=Notechis scutatus TaxID=8663 RepID=A0A6J1VEY0_9SAUR|nr:interleukin-17 receptor E [Notechis scutatus]